MFETILASTPAILLLGLSFGASACMLACIPTLGVALLSHNHENTSSKALAARFNAGRFFGYSLLGLISGSIGASITQGLNPDHAAWIFGALLIFSGLLLWKRTTSMGCTKKTSSHGSLFKGSMFSMGLGMSLTPCLPLASVCAAAASTGSPWFGLLLGATFALGAIIPAQLLLGYGLNSASIQFRQQLSLRAPQLSRLGGGLLILTGLSVFIGFIQL
ncbi:MAG: sulfite exporter TauE/SafE family protein [Mariprofundaceae bacterium]|nr:sulfite exporter TauE/SafE family protein [Mariprofundaceae bacterium]